METILGPDLAIRCALPAEQNDRILPVVLCIHVLIFDFTPHWAELPG